MTGAGALGANTRETTMSTLVWTGPFRINALLAASLDDDHPWPPASRGVYVVSRDGWWNAPSPACHPLYFGGNTGDSQRFCTRIGDLIADLHGLGMAALVITAAASRSTPGAGRTRCIPATSSSAGRPAHPGAIDVRRSSS